MYFKICLKYTGGDAIPNLPKIRLQCQHKSLPVTEGCVDRPACKDWVEEWLDMTIEPLKEGWVVRLVVVAC